MKLRACPRQTLLLVAIASAALSATAASPRSISYEIESASVATHGSIANEGAYTIVSQVKTSGFSQDLTSSADYQILPVAAGNNDAAINLWMLY